jgi:hypothetical protein
MGGVPWRNVSNTLSLPNSPLFPCLHEGRSENCCDILPHLRPQAIQLVNHGLKPPKASQNNATFFKLLLLGICHSDENLTNTTLPRNVEQSKSLVLILVYHSYNLSK